VKIAVRACDRARYQMRCTMRLNRLDVLRAVAVFMVLGRHVYVSGYLMRTGWMGVDLFFVLSGYLVTGLLLAEQRKLGAMRPVRFWLRRGFKIYPPFYALVIASAIFRFHQEGSVWPEALFVQNYAHGWWHHTWSLAVEEHFYLLLPIALWLLARSSARQDTEPRDPFTKLPLLVGVVMAVALALRVVTFAIGPHDAGVDFFFHHVCPTHLRIDSLAIGALLAYVYHYKKDAIARLGRGRLFAIGAASALLLLPWTFADVEQSVALATFGLPLIAIAFAGVLVVFVQWPRIAPRSRAISAIARGLGYVGRHSYSIYLWHMPVKVLTERAFARFAPHARDQFVFVVFAVISVAVGIAFAKLIENPALRLRDRLLPTPLGPVASMRPQALRATASAPVPDRTEPAPDDRCPSVPRLARP
jgi:peptidoglycan/LPS O-acetylase OafA/YrhL